MSEVITVGQGRYTGETNEVLQRAVDDAAAAGGGVVHVEPATYHMHNALKLRTGVRVVGLGEGEHRPVLRKVPSVSSRLTLFVGYGHFEFAVEEPEKFSVGMGVHITDDNSMGFYDTAASIIDREGDLFFLDRSFHHDYLARDGGIVTSLFPIVEGFKVHDAGIANVIVDGNVEETRELNGCRGGGVFLLRCDRMIVDAVEVRHWRGDAIGWQQCTDVAVRRCHVHHNTGKGLHPGSGTVRYVMLDNHVHDNGLDGLFYCLRTTHSICRGNRIENNAGAGISINERDTDQQISGNVVVGNGGPGVIFATPQAQSGDRVRLEGNTIGPNGTGETAAADRAEIQIPAGLNDVLMSENNIQPNDGAAALSVGGSCANICFVGNTVGDRQQQPADVSGEVNIVSFDPPADFPDIRPEALPLSGARHLGLAEIAPWREPV